MKELVTDGLLKRENRRGTFVDNGILSQGLHNRTGIVAAFVIGIENPQWSTFEQKMNDMNFTAIFAANDQIAEAAIKSFERLGYKIPKDVSVVTYDAANINQRLNRNLTGATQPFYEMGQLAAKQMLNLIEGKDNQVVFGQVCKSEMNTGNSIAAI